MKTLFYHAGALGDFVTVLPAIRYWRVTHPRDSIVLLCRPSIGTIAVSSGYVDELWDASSLQFCPLFARDSGDAVKRLLFGIRRAICFADQDSPVLHNLRKLKTVEILRQDPFPARRVTKFTFHLSLLTNNPGYAAHTSPLLFAPRVNLADLSLPNRPLVIMHPGSGSQKKNWPLAKFAYVSDLLKRVGCSVLWIIGPVESSMTAPSGVRVIRNKELPYLLGVLSQGDLYLGNDSGISHCAAAAGCPSIVIFGPSDPVVWRPFGDNVTILYAGQDCSPCHGPDGCNPKPNCSSECLESITPYQVFAECRRVLSL